MPVPPGILSLVARAEGGPFYTTSQVATMVGRSPDTIRRWAKKPECAPTHRMPLGKGKAYVKLYTDADISRLKRYALKQHAGPLRKGEK